MTGCRWYLRPDVLFHFPPPLRILVTQTQSAPYRYSLVSIFASVPHPAPFSSAPCSPFPCIILDFAFVTSFHIPLHNKALDDNCIYSSMPSRISQVVLYYCSSLPLPLSRYFTTYPTIILTDNEICLEVTVTPTLIAFPSPPIQPITTSSPRPQPPHHLSAWMPLPHR